jgi:integrase
MTITSALPPSTDLSDLTDGRADGRTDGLTDGLTDEDAARVAAAYGAARTSCTRAVYAHAWRQWQRWCAARGLPSLPGDPAALCAYLAERAAHGTAVATLNVACSAIGNRHRTQGLPDTVAHGTVRQVRAGLRRSYGIAPRRQARPLSVAELRQILTHLDQGRPIGVRDTAIILLGYSGALRRAELTDLTLADVEHQTAGLLLTLRTSKTDQEGRGQVIGIAHGVYAATDPVAALDAWLDLRGRGPGPLFTRVYASRIHADPLTGNAITRMLHTRAKAAGLPAERITAHSLRAGHATTAALAGVPLERIAAQTRHRDPSVLVERYIRPLEALAHTSSRDLGL